MMSEKRELMEFLCDEPRPAGSMRNKMVEGYLVQHYQELGYQVEVQSVSFTGWRLHHPPMIEFLEPESLKVDYDEQPWMPVVWSPPTQGVVEGFLAYDRTIKTFERYPWKRYTVTDGKNTLAYLLSSTGMVWAQPMNNWWSRRIPHLMVGSDECLKIEDWRREEKKICVRVSLDCEFVPDQTVSNIIVSSEVNSPIVICAHYDSMHNTIGAHDNASGVAALLEVARSAKQMGSGEGLRFINFDAEEYNKLGAYRYVSSLKRSSSLDQIQLVINIDSVGVGNALYVLTSPEIEGEVQKLVEESSSNPDVYEVKSRKKFGQFDSWPFMKTKRIPVMQIGSTHTVYNQFRWWHHPKDTLENVDYSLIDKAAKLVLNLAQRYSRIVEAWNAKR